MGRRLTIYPEKCTGCRLCEFACSFNKTGLFNAMYSRVRVSAFGMEAFYIPIVCRQCEDAWCLRACPSGSIFRDPKDKVVKIDEERCVGCRMCIMACPFGAVTFYAPHGKAIKCDECDGDPQCAKICAIGALTYEEESAEPRAKRTKTARKILSGVREAQS